MWIGADSFVGNADSRDINDRSKIRKRGAAWVAFAGDLAIGQAVESSPPWDARKRGEDTRDYLVRAVAPKVRAIHRDTPQPGAFSMLVVLDAKAFEVGFDGGVRRSLRGVVAIGAGESFALGALHALAQEPPERRVRAALAAAAEWSPHVVRPFHIVRV